MYSFFTCSMHTYVNCIELYLIQVVHILSPGDPEYHSALRWNDYFTHLHNCRMFLCGTTFDVASRGNHSNTNIRSTALFLT